MGDARTGGTIELKLSTSARAALPLVDASGLR
jgi:hypothetical protein